MFSLVVLAPVKTKNDREVVVIFALLDIVIWRRVGRFEGCIKFLTIKESCLGPRRLRSHGLLPGSKSGPGELKRIVVQQPQQCRRHILFARRRRLSADKCSHELRKLRDGIAFPKGFLRRLGLHAFMLVVSHAIDSTERSLCG